ncbi:hypothetical protein FF1_028044 [Malus domestica]
MALAALTAIFNGIDPRASFYLRGSVIFLVDVWDIYRSCQAILAEEVSSKELACDPCLRHCCLHWCALCQ